MRKVHVLHYMFNHVKLLKIDIPVGKELNVDAYIAVKDTLIFNIKLESDLCYRLVNFCVAWGGKYAVLHVDDEDEFASIEHAVFHPGLLQSYLFYYLGEVLVTHHRPLPLTK